MQKIVKESLTERIYEYIKDQIITGEWKTGEKLPSETELASLLGVSRLSLRMAIQKTNVLGLTETLVGEGTFVKDFSMFSYFEEIFHSKIIEKNDDEMWEFRMILQIGSLRLAFEKDNLNEHIQNLKDIYVDMEEALNEDDLERYHKADANFHQEICNMCNNKFMTLLYESFAQLISNITQRNSEISIKKNKGYTKILEFHKKVIDIVENKDLEAFVELERRSHKRFKENVTD